jgi:CRP-like cAMP-binding protein
MVHAAAPEVSRAMSAGGRDEPNKLLAALSEESWARIALHLEPVTYSLRETLWEADAPIRRVVFPRTCVLSLIVPLKDEHPVEAATIGFEGLAGVPVVLGATSTHATAFAQIPGSAASMTVSAFRALLDEDPELKGLLLRYAQVLLDQTAQSVACNRRHSMEERCARWLLTTHDRVGGQQFPLTQEFLAQMLGVRRASVTVAAGMLQKAGFIKYSRGRVTIVDRDGLEKCSCECYKASWDSYHRQLGP